MIFLFCLLNFFPVGSLPLPLLSRPGTPSEHKPLPDAHPRLHTLCWLEYHLPDGTVYCVHPMNRVTTEINLRRERKLTDVELFLADCSKDQSGSAMEGRLTFSGEIWLRDVGTAKSGLVLERWWVDHRLRTVVMGGNLNMLGKDLEKTRRRREVPSSLKKIVSSHTAFL